MADFRDVRLRWLHTYLTIGPDGFPQSAEEEFPVSDSNPMPVQIYDENGNVSPMLFPFRYYNITGQTTNNIKSGLGVLHCITFNKPVATSAVTIYDGDAVDATRIIGTITIPASPMQTYFLYDIQFSKGLTVVQATASSDITVVYI